MITITQTSQKNLSSSEEIIEFLSAEYERMKADAAFAPGDEVTITKRDGIPSEMAVGDVGIVVLCQEAPSPFTHILCVHQTGNRLIIQVQTANLSKRVTS